MRPRFQQEVQGNDGEAKERKTKDGGAEGAETTAGETKAQEKKPKYAEYDALFWRVLDTDKDYVGEQ